jgi:anaerobic magnesium-protoporphyrin IX monomethyl ester cyclase
MARHIRITLLVPRASGHINRHNLVEPMGVMHLVAVLRSAGHTVSFLDLNLANMEEQSEVQQRLERVLTDAELVGFSVTGASQLESARFLAEEAQRVAPRALLLAGGVLPTFVPASFLTEIPMLHGLIRGEAEYTLSAVATRRSEGLDWTGVAGVCFVRGGRVIERPPASPVQILDTLPFAARDACDEALAAGNPATLLTSRGCWSRCSFCASQELARLVPGSPWRARSSYHVMQELDLLWDSRRLTKFHINDDNFVGPGRSGRKRALTIASAMRSRDRDYRFSAEMRADVIDSELLKRLVDAGLQSVIVGIESWAPSQLARLGKRSTVEANERALEVLLAHGPREIRLGCIMFDPWTTVDELRTQIAFLTRYPHYEIGRYANTLQILPGTEVERTLRAEGRLDGDWRAYSYRFRDKRVALIHSIVVPVMNELARVEDLALHSDVLDTTKSRPTTAFIDQLRQDALCFFKNVVDHHEEGLRAAPRSREAFVTSGLDRGQAMKNDAIRKLALLRLLTRPEGPSGRETRQPVHEKTPAPHFN